MEKIRRKIRKLQSRNPIQIGMRTFKTWIATTVTGLVALTPIIGNPFYALMGTVFGMQSTVANSFKLGVGRVIGTAIGAFVGFLFAYFGLTSPPLIAIAIAVVIIITNILNIRHSIMITITLCLLIIFNPDREGGLFNYAFFRTLDTTIGVVIGFVVNRFISPPNHLRFLVNELEALQKIAKNTCTDDSRLPELQREIAKLTVFHSNYQADKKYDKHDVSNESLRKTIEACNDLYFHFKNVKTADPTVATYHTDKISEAFVLLEESVKLLKEVV